MMFLFGSERSTLLTNIAGVPLKIPSASNVMLYQFTSPVAVPSEFAAVGIARVDLVHHRVQIEEHARLARRRVDSVNHARAIDRAVGALSPAPREIA